MGDNQMQSLPKIVSITMLVASITFADTEGGYYQKHPSELPVNRESINWMKAVINEGNGTPEIQKTLERYISQLQQDSLKNLQQRSKEELQQRSESISQNLQQSLQPDTTMPIVQSIGETIGSLIKILVEIIKNLIAGILSAI